MLEYIHPNSKTRKEKLLQLHGDVMMPIITEAPAQSVHTNPRSDQVRP